MYVWKEIKVKIKCDAWMLKLQVNIVNNSQETNLTITSSAYF